MEIPRELTAGDAWSWTDSLSDYPAPTWVLTYYFRGPKTFNKAATASGANHVTSLDATESDVQHGAYSWQARAVNGTNKVTVGAGRLTVKPNLANVSVDHRSFNQRCLDDLEAVIASGMQTADQQSYTIGGRSQAFRDWDEVLAMKDKFAMKVAGELGLKPGRVFTRFGE